MKKHFTSTILLFRLLLLIFIVSASLGASSQVISITITGFNADVIADPLLQTLPATVTNAAVDNGTGNVFYTQGYGNGLSADANGLPLNGIVHSSTGHVFQLQPYNTNNDIRLSTTSLTILASGFSNVNQVSYDSLFILATAGNGPANLIYHILFHDGSMTIGNISISDWSCNACTIQGVRNLSRANSQTGIVTQPGQFAMGEYKIPLSLNDKIKKIDGITFLNDVLNTGVINIFAVSGSPLITLPVALTSFNTTLNNDKVVLQWQTGFIQNTSKFIIERSVAASANNFETVGSIATTASAGSTSYSFINNPGVNGSYIYRLSLQGSDGNIKILGTRSVVIADAKQWVVQPVGYGWRLISNAAFSYQLMDVNGIVLQKGTGAGNTDIMRPSARGLYFLKVWQGTSVTTKKLVN